MKTLRERDGFSKEEVDDLKFICENVFSEILSLISKYNLDRPLKTYNILERKMGRFEISCQKDPLYSLLLKNNNFKKQDFIIKQFFKRKWNVDPSIDVGLLSVLGESEDGDFHRDCHFYDSWNELKPFYFTLLVYLDELSGTEFILPHKNISLFPEGGKITVFDGSIEHRGLANSSLSPRHAIYLTYLHPDYIDEDNHLPRLKNILDLKKRGEKV